MLLTRLERAAGPQSGDGLGGEIEQAMGGPALGLSTAAKVNEDSWKKAPSQLDGTLKGADRRALAPSVAVTRVRWVVCPLLCQRPPGPYARLQAYPVSRYRLLAFPIAVQAAARLVHGPGGLHPFPSQEGGPPDGMGRDRGGQEEEDADQDGPVGDR